MSINEKQLGPITVLDRDGYSGFVNTSGSLIINMSGIVINEQSDSPAPGTSTSGTVWLRDDDKLIFTNQNDEDTVLGAGSNILSTAGGLTNTDTITSILVDSTVTIDLPNIKLGTTHTVIGTGTQSLAALPGLSNTVIGYNASGFTGASPGGNSTVVGATAAVLENKGTAIGALSSVQLGSTRSVVVGYGSTIQGVDNTIVGAESGTSGGVNNTLIGAAHSVTAGGANNTLIGSQAGGSSQGNRLTVMGALAGTGNFIGNDHIIIGHDTANTGTIQAAGSLSNIVIGNDSAKSGLGGSMSNNVLIGHNVAAVVQSDNNVIIGSASGAALTTGVNNTLIGTGTNVASATVANSIGIGTATVATGAVGIGTPATAFGENVIAIGMLATSFGADSIAIGKGSFAGTIDQVLLGTDVGNNGAGATIIGTRAGSGAGATGVDNVIVGTDAAAALTTSGENVIVGTDAAAAWTEGNQNTLIGDGGAPLITGTGNSGNVIMGAGAAPLATTAALAVVLGTNAMNGATGIGINTIAIGNAAVGNNTTGTGNIGIGSLTCGGVTTGSNNIMIGQQVGGNNADGDNNIVFANQMTWQAGSNASRNFIVNQAVDIHNGDDNIFLMSSGPIDITTVQSDYTAIKNFGNGLQINVDGRSAAAFGLRDQIAADEVLITAQTIAELPLAAYTQDDNIAVFALDTTEDATNGAGVQFFTGNRNPNGNVTGAIGSTYYQAVNNKCITWKNTDGASRWTNITYIPSEAAAPGIVGAGSTLDLTMPTVALGKTETYNIRVKTLTGTTYDYYRGVCIVQRDGTGTLINRLYTVSGFNDVNFTISASEASDIVTITFTNNSGTPTVNTHIEASIESESIPA